MEKLRFQQWLPLSEEKRNKYISHFFGKCGELSNTPPNIEIGKVYGMIQWGNHIPLIRIKKIACDKKTVTYELPNGKNNKSVIIAESQLLVDAKSAAIHNCISTNVSQAQDSFNYLHNNF